VSCRLDGGSFAPCASPYTANGLTIGEHTLEVKAIDDSGASTVTSTTWTVVAAGGPDVRIAMEASQREVIAGKEFNTTVTATNMGGRSAEDVVLHIALPPGTEFVSGTASRGATQQAPVVRYGPHVRTTASAKAFPCTVDGLDISCPVGELRPADQFIVQLTLRALRTGTIEVGAQLQSSNAKAQKAQVWLNARPPKLDIAVELKTSGSYDRVRRGEVFTATGTVRNVGGSTAEEVAVRVALPSIAKFVSGTKECTLTGSTLRCPIGALEPRDRFVIRLRLLARRSGQVRIVAIGSSANQHGVRSHLVLHAAVRVSQGHASAAHGSAAVTVQKQQTLVAVVHFASASSALSRRAQAVLQRLGRRVVAGHVRTLTLTCHTDDNGSLFYNLGLSKERCSSVQSYLERHGAGRVRIAAAAFAYLRPAASNATPAGKAENRRVEIRGKETVGAERR
jgi:uncharacterized repeat protein (TIGR01451 family)